SGAVINPLIPNLKDAERNGAKIAQGLKASSGDGTLKYLRGLSVKEILTGTGTQNPLAPPVFGPIIDGWVLPRSGAVVFAEGRQAAIPLMIGVTAREFTLNGGVEAARGMINAFAGSLAPRVLASYGLADGGVGKPDPLY